MPFEISNYPGIFNRPEFLVKDSFWKEHIPFAYFLLDILRPAVLVELGVFQGGSFNVFCDAAKSLSLDLRCFGVDTWEGDPHNGFYSQEIYEALYAIHREHYHGISTLLRMTFDRALDQFADGSVDLLHIDGYHLYEAVKHDFQSWLPKMSGTGVIIFHDTDYRERDYGVWRLWDEIAPLYPSCHFRFGCGLGVLAVGERVKPEFLDFLRGMNENPFYHRFFLELGGNFPLRQQLDQQSGQLGEAHRINETLQNELERAHAQIREQERVIHLQDERLQAIYASASWRMSQRLSRIRHAVCPDGSRRGRWLKRILGSGPK